MTQYFRIHPSNPEPRLVSQAVAILRRGGVIAYPTDSSYALGCEVGNARAVERIRRIRRVSQKHDFTLLCGGVKELSGYAKLSNANFLLIKRHTPGPYTFVLPATREVPKRLQHPRKATVGIRIPDHTILTEMLAALGEALISSTLTLPDDDYPMMDPAEIHQRLAKKVELVIDGGHCGYQPSSVVDLTQEAPAVLRHGGGDVTGFQ